MKNDALIVDSITYNGHNDIELFSFVRKHNMCFTLYEDNFVHKPHILVSDKQQKSYQNIDLQIGDIIAITDTKKAVLYKCENGFYSFEISLN